jgi:hypothetical protein
VFGATIFWCVFWLAMGFALGGSFVSQSGVPMTPLVLTLRFYFASAICALSLAILLTGVGLIWSGSLSQKLLSEKGFRNLRMGLTVLAAIYAGYCAWRLIFNVAIPMNLDREFAPELIAYSIFWVLLPPIWFFIAYFAVESRWISGLPDNIENKLKTIRDYADYASKIWAGVLALLVALIAMKK